MKNKSKIMILFFIIFIFILIFNSRFFNIQSEDIYNLGENQTKKNEKSEVDFLFGIGNANAMTYITDTIGSKKDMTIEFYIKNTSNKKINTIINMFYQKHIDDELDKLSNLDNNTFKLEINEVQTNKVTFKLPENVDYDNLKISMQACDLEGESLVNISGQFYYFDK